MLAPDILTMNNRGVDMLRLGNLSDAEQLFRQCLLGSLVEFVPCNQTSHHSLCAAADTQASSIPFWHQVEVEEVYYESNAVPHMQGLCLDESVVQLYDDTVATQSIISAILIYNLGIVDLRHSFGQRTSSETSELRLLRREQLLDRAMCLFEKAIFILERTGIRYVTNVAILDFLIVALYNNVGCILVENKRYGAAKVAFNKVTRMVFALQRLLLSTGKTDPVAIEYIKGHLESFTLNALLLHEPSSASAA